MSTGPPSTTPALLRVPEPACSVFPCLRNGPSERAALHLPVAPRCNVQCVHCRRDGDCIHHSPRSSSARPLSVQQAVSYALEALRREPRICSVGVTGPGEPLANAGATFGTLSLIRAQHPELPFFLATNGLAIVDHVATLVSLGVSLDRKSVV